MTITATATTVSEFSKMNLPRVQKQFMAQFEGTLESILNFPELNKVLNPTFSYHYFCTELLPNGEVGSTKDTTGACAPWGSQSPTAEQNASLLANELKAYFKKQELYVNIAGQYHSYDPKKGYAKSKLYVNCYGVMRRVIGLSTSNIN